MAREVLSPCSADRRGLYPPIEPYECGFIDVADGHRIYWELCGNPEGVAAVFLHGGPGGGCNADSRRLFDPDRYRLLLFDQRGCGRSSPSASLEANTTWHLISDMERLREMIGIERWLVLGGSWGSSLALAYAETHPHRVTALVMRGVFTGRRSELRWLFENGASMLFPDSWERFISLIPPGERGSLLSAYRKLLTSPERAVRLVAAKRWCAWERDISTLLPTEQTALNILDDDAALALAEIGSHYFAHDCFLEEGQLLRDAGRLAGIPGLIVQGRYDVVTPPRTAWELHRAWPGSELLLVSDAGHATHDPGLVHHLVTATDFFADQACQTADGGAPCLN
jgi:proline iminopeptidase